MELSAIEREAIRQMNRKKEKVSKKFRKEYKKETGKQYRQKTIGPNLKKECDDLWIELIKKRAGYRSELSGKGKNEGIIITSHHIAGKPNTKLRYLVENGICLENHKEHIFGVHNKFNPPIANEYQNKIIDYIGKERWEYLKSLRADKSKADLALIKIYLQKELKNI